MECSVENSNQYRFNNFRSIYSTVTNNIIITVGAFQSESITQTVSNFFWISKSKQIIQFNSYEEVP